jgi:GTP-binding protein
LVKRHQILAANKIDLIGEKKAGLEEVRKLARREGLPFFAISALKEEGLKKLVNSTSKALDLLREKKE